MDVLPMIVENEVLAKLEIGKTNDEWEEKKMEPSIGLDISCWKKINEKNDRGINQEIVKNQLVEIYSFNLKIQWARSFSVNMSS